VEAYWSVPKTGRPNPNFDPSTAGRPVPEIEVLTSTDGTLIVQIDTPEMAEDDNGPILRVYLNDGELWDNPPYSPESIRETDRPSDIFGPEEGTPEDEAKAVIPLWLAAQLASTMLGITYNTAINVICKNLLEDQDEAWRIKMKHKYPVCPHCGSDDITVSTDLYWSISAQCWEPSPVVDIGAVVDIGGGTDCQNCGASQFDPLFRTPGEDHYMKITIECTGRGNADLSEMDDDELFNWLLKQALRNYPQPIRDINGNKVATVEVTAIQESRE